MITITIEATDSSEKIQLSDELESSIQSFITRSLDGRVDPDVTVARTLLTQIDPFLKQVSDVFPSAAVQAAKADLESAQAALDAAKAAAVTKVDVGIVPGPSPVVKVQ